MISKSDSILTPHIKLPSFNSAATYDTGKANKINRNLKDKFATTVNHLKDSSRHHIASLFKDTSKLVPAKARPVHINGGWISDEVAYRSNVDTPFMDKHLLQNNLSGVVQFSVMDKLPLNLSFFTQVSNSKFLHNVFSFRLDLDPVAYAKKMQEQQKEKLLRLIDRSGDSALIKKFFSTSQLLAKYKSEFDKQQLKQKFLDSKEVINVPKMLYDNKLPDSLAKAEADSVTGVAKIFVDFYEKKLDTLQRLQKEYDSLYVLYQKEVSRIDKCKEMIKNPGSITDWASLKQVEKTLLQNGVKSDSSFSSRYQWLLGFKKVGLGKSQLNYSELTGKNVPLNGINLEYNTWFYASLAAGFIDYRFRDFAYQQQKRKPQYFFMARIGVGSLSKNYLILSVFGGKKQLYTYNSATGNNTYAQPVYGVSLESKFQITPNTYVKAEVAQSMASDLKVNPSQKPSFVSLNNDNKAFAVSFRSWVPKIGLTTEGNYKYTGANYQSFGSYQVSTSLATWYVRADKYFFKKVLRVTASVRNSDYTNPYVVQKYSANNVFKTFQVTFRKKKWPVISAGYIPTSQYSVVDKTVYESKFYALNASITHSYKIGAQRLASVFIYNKLRNNPGDTGYMYNNATNFYFTQNIFLKSLTESLSASYSSNHSYTMSTLFEQVDIPVSVKGSLNAGVRIVNFNSKETKLGGSGSFHYRINGKSAAHITYDQMYYPGSSNVLVKSEFLSVGYNQSF